MKIQIFLSTLILFAVGCGSEPAKVSPEWIHQPTRVVDNGYIVYVGVASAPTAERAQFKAEGIALEDMANECSLIPKGSRIEDRYSEAQKYESTAYVKLAIEFQECDEAQKTIDPQEIKKIANVGFTEQLRKYQELAETGEMPGQMAAVEPPEQIADAPERAPGWNDSTHFFVTRQYIAYQKEIVVLSPPTAYAANTPANRDFMTKIQPQILRVQGLQHSQPVLRNQAWSQIPHRPAVNSPPGLIRKTRSSWQPLRPPQNPGRYGRGKQRARPVGRRRRRGMPNYESQ